MNHPGIASQVEKSTSRISMFLLNSYKYFLFNTNKMWVMKRVQTPGYCHSVPPGQMLFELPKGISVNLLVKGSSRRLLPNHL